VLEELVGVNPATCPWEGIFILSTRETLSDLLFTSDGHFHDYKGRLKPNATKPYLLLCKPLDQGAYERQSDPTWMERVVSVQQTDFPAHFFHEIARGNVYQYTMELYQPLTNTVLMKPGKATRLSIDLLKYSTHKSYRLYKDSTREENFLSQLEVMQEKSWELRNRGFTVAADAADVLVQTSRNHSADYFGNQIDYTMLKRNSEQAIHLAKPELEKHRGWKRLLMNLALCIAGLGVFYVAAGLIHKAVKGHFLFFNETDSIEKLHKLGQALQSIQPIQPQR
jgi:hypothetical protein